MAGSGDVVLDTKVLDQIRLNLVSRTAEAVLTIAQDAADDMKNSFGVSVSSPGDPPGVDTGTLFSSMEGKMTGATESGVFGASYGIDYLEDGTLKMAARPFIRPALDRVFANVPEYFKAVVKT